MSLVTKEGRRYKDTGDNQSERAEKRCNMNNKILDETLKYEIQALLIENSGATVDDLARWFDQGFVFNESFPNFGLIQNKGGPCGIISAVQSEIIKYIYFEEQLVNIESVPSNEVQLIEPGADLLVVALVKGFQSILSRVSESSCLCIALAQNLNIVEVSSIFMLDIELNYVTDADECFEILYNNISQFQSKLGCILLLISIILTRGIEYIRSDMDLQSNTLIGQFGHCNQELLNLVLTGRATSNAIDGDLPLGDSGLILKGVSRQSSIGYLTHLESLGLCQVGDYYKVPELPIWVIGSSSHFSVIFSLDKNVNELTTVEKFLSITKHAFNLIDVEKNGFIPSNRLKEALIYAGLEYMFTDEVDLIRLQSNIQTDGEIIIFSQFWTYVSRLLNGESLNSVLMNNLDQNGNITKRRSDSDIARELQQSLNTEGAETININQRNWDFNRPRSDSQIARELQERFNSDLTWDEPTTSTSFQSIVDISNSQMSSSSSAVETNQAVIGVKKDERQFYLYYYNGIHLPSRKNGLTTIKITLKESIDSIGSPTTVNDANLGGNICAIEEVIRTRWKDCAIEFNGQTVPSIE